MTKKKDYGFALVIWFFTAGFGGHRVYIKESPVTLLWYWLANICTIGILMFVDLFLLKGMIEKKYEEDKMKEHYLSSQYSQK